VNDDSALCQKEMEITEKWLGEIGGWAAMKAARAVLAAGKVEVTEKSPSLIRGYVGTGKGRMASGLRIRSKSDVETLCTCPQARRTGAICDHALAVGLASISQIEIPPTAAPAPKAAVAPSAPQAASTAGELSLFLPEGLFQAGAAVSARPVTAFLKAEPTGQETSGLVAWLAGHGLPCQSMPLQLPPTQFGGLLAALVEHPRVFVGKPPAGQHRPLQVVDAEARPLLELTQEGSEVRLQLSEQPPPVPLGDIASGNVWLYHPAGDSLHPWQAPSDPEAAKLAAELWRSGKAGLRRPLRWLASSLGALEEAFQVQLTGGLEAGFHVLPVPAEYELEVAGSLQVVQLRVTGLHGDLRWGLFEKTTLFPLAAADAPATFYVRDQVKERGIWRRLEALGLVIQGGSGSFELRGPREVMRFFASDLPRLAADFRIKEAESWQRATRGLVRIAPEIQMAEAASGGSAGAGNDWLTMTFDYRAPDGFRLS